ncbi:MAG: hypothetical protein ABS87_01470 [Sphingomonas sp. SCN 67-18]|uniref:hypothetical protein n=1 Tax=uncultured Sphingomonas sp. TaxID=158754 RepID=UPI00086A5E4C|nr:hypothetical protein [Sphingomonas sp. SCN 67-18]ODU22676.1 MAG: hypothetical protein ABS87_01470 [Sphingomonas sp. SCN 67-18]
MRAAIYIALFSLSAAPALANSLVAPGPRAGIAKSGLSATPAGEWNRLSRSDGKNVELWTLDGDSLNKVTFFGGIAAGQPLVREVDKKNRPLRKVAADMLITDIPALLESTYRSQFAVNQMEIATQEPALLSGNKGIRFTYDFTRADDEVRRKGEGVGAMVNGRLYLVIFEAPALYFFDRDVEKYRALVATLKL